jgi:hypothetical protein
MSLLDLLLPQLNEIMIPLIIILLGIAITFGLGWLPFIGSKFVMLGIGTIAVGILFWIISIKAKSFLQIILSKQIIGIAIGIIFLIIFGVFMLGKKRK